MGLVPRLPRAAWIVLGGDLLSALGSGMTMPFFIVYLHRVRGIDLTVASLALATIAAASFAGNVIGGSASDRFGSRRTLMLGLVSSAAGAGRLSFVTAAPAAFRVRSGLRGKRDRWLGERPIRLATDLDARTGVERRGSRLALVRDVRAGSIRR